MYSQTFPPKSKFSVDDIPDLTGKVAIVTGSNTYAIVWRLSGAGGKI